jgi:hypothetical protein
MKGNLSRKGVRVTGWSMRQWVMMVKDCTVQAMRRQVCSRLLRPEGAGCWPQAPAGVEVGPVRRKSGTPRQPLLVQWVKGLEKMAHKRRARARNMWSPEEQFGHTSQELGLATSVSGAQQAASQ